MLRLTANLGLLWPDRPLLARIDAAARTGFRAIELHFPYDVPAAEVAAAVRRNGMTLLGINTPPGRLDRGELGLAAVAGREAQFMADFDRAVDYCLAAGASRIHVMAGNMPAADRAHARTVFAGNLQWAASKAAAHDLLLLLEPLNPYDHPDYFYSTLDAAVALIEQSGMPNIKLQFDVYHVARAEGDALARLANYLPYVANVQIASVPKRVEPDEGEILYGEVFAALRKLDYSGWVACEYRPRGDTDAGLRWLRTVE